MSVAKLWTSDDGLCAIVQRELFTCAVGGVMDHLNFEQCYSPAAGEIDRQVHCRNSGAGIGNRL